MAKERKTKHNKEVGKLIKLNIIKLILLLLLLLMKVNEMYPIVRQVLFWSMSTVVQ